MKNRVWQNLKRRWVVILLVTFLLLWWRSEEPKSSVHIWIGSIAAVVGVCEFIIKRVDRRREDSGLQRIARANEERNKLTKEGLEAEEKERQPNFVFKSHLAGKLTLKNVGKTAAYLGIEDIEASNISIDPSSKKPRRVENNQRLDIQVRSKNTQYADSNAPYKFKIIYKDVAGKKYFQAVECTGNKWNIMQPEIYIS